MTHAVGAIVPVDRLTAHGQLFRCEPLHATMPVRACLARRAATTQPRFGAKRPLHPTCAACPIGAAIAARVEGRPDSGAPAGRVCVEPGCSVVVTGGHPRMKPRCPDHRSPASTTPTTHKEITTMPAEALCPTCQKRPASPTTAKTPSGTETWCGPCRRGATVRARKAARAAGRPRKDATTVPAPTPAAPAPTIRLIVPPEAAEKIASAAAPLRPSSPIRVTVVTIECDASLAGSLSALVAGLR